MEPMKLIKKLRIAHFDDFGDSSIKKTPFFPPLGALTLQNVE